MKLLTQLAHELQDLIDENHDLRREVEDLREYRRKYVELLDGSIQHSRNIMGGILKLATTPGVMDAIDQHNRNVDASGSVTTPT